MIKSEKAKVDKISYQSFIMREDISDVLNTTIQFYRALDDQVNGKSVSLSNILKDDCSDFDTLEMEEYFRDGINFAEQLLLIHELNPKECNLSRANHCEYITKSLLSGAGNALRSAALNNSLNDIDRAMLRLSALGEYSSLLMRFSVYAYGELRSGKMRRLGLFPGLYARIAMDDKIRDPAPIVYVWKSKELLENGIFSEFKK